jgi:hypothetical protein
MSWLDALSESKAASRPVPGGNATGLAEGQGRGEGRPGADFNESANWADILEPFGAILHHKASDGERYWTRPGKDKRDGYSATTGYADDADRLMVFSSSWSPFTQGGVYTKFGAYALLNHGGDHKAAAWALAQQGYGEQLAVADPGAGDDVPWPTGPAPGGSGESVRHAERDAWACVRSIQRKAVAR